MRTARKFAKVGAESSNLFTAPFIFSLRHSSMPFYLYTNARKTALTLGFKRPHFYVFVHFIPQINRLYPINLGAKKLLSLSIHPETTLSEARKKCQEARKNFAENIGPSAAKKGSRQRQIDESTRQHGYPHMEMNIFLEISALPITEIKAAQITPALKVGMVLNP